MTISQSLDLDKKVGQCEQISLKNKQTCWTMGQECVWWVACVLWFNINT